jgi:uncharacterized membrane protein
MVENLLSDRFFLLTMFLSVIAVIEGNYVLFSMT